MTSVRNSTYSTHSVADAHLLAILDGEQDPSQINEKGSRLSTLFPTKLLETILIIPSSVSRKHEDDMAGDRLSTTSFDDMQRSVQIIGLPKPAKSRTRLSHYYASEHIINDDDAPMDDSAQATGYNSEPQMQYTTPGRSNALTPEYRQQGCGYRYPTYYGGPCGRIGSCGYGRGGYGYPQRPPQAYFPGGRRQRRYGGGYYYGAGGCGQGRGCYSGCGPYATQRPMLVRRHGGFCCCC